MNGVKLPHISQEYAAQAAILSKQIRPLLQGRGPDVQGAELADLVSIWLIGHAPELREEMFTLWIGCVRHLLPLTEKEFFGEGGWHEQS